MIIDIHSHAYKNPLPYVTPFCSPEELIAKYDEMGVDKAVLLPVVNPEIYLPQAVETIRTRNTDGIALPTFLMMAIGAFAFVVQGLLHRPGVIWSMVVTNAVTCLCSIIVFAIKMYNDISKRRGRR